MIKFSFNLSVYILLSFSLLSCYNSSGSKSNVKTNELVCDTILLATPESITLEDIESTQKSIEHFVFRITNASDNLLFINKIDISCNCLKIINYPDSLFAGQTGEITGEIDFKNQSGHLRKSIFITYNNSSIKMLKITANVK